LNAKGFYLLLDSIALRTLLLSALYMELMNNINMFLTSKSPETDLVFNQEIPGVYFCFN